MNTPRHIVLLAHEGMNMIDLSGPLQAFTTASRVAAEREGDAGTARTVPLYQVTVASAHGGLVTTGPGLAVMTVALAALPAVPVDTLIAPGGSMTDAYPRQPELVAWIKANAAGARRVCSVCTGAFLLAAAGVLDGKQVTTHWEWAGRLHQAFPAVAVNPEPIFIQSGKVWTSAGVTAGIDLTLALIEADVGHRIAIATARQMVMFLKRPGSQSQFSVPLAAQSKDRSGFAELHAWIAANLSGDLRVEALARRVNMTPRTFARIYVAQIGRTPARTVEAMRIEAACRALEETDLPLKRIATDTGHGEEQNLRRVFQRQLGVSPAQYRSRFSAHQMVH